MANLDFNPNGVPESEWPALGEALDCAIAGLADSPTSSRSVPGHVVASSCLAATDRPREGCGFEIDTTGYFDPGDLGSAVGGCGPEPPRNRARVEREPVPSPRPRVDAGAVPAADEPWVDQVDSGLWGDAVQPDRDGPGLFSRPRIPEVPGYEILEELGRGGMGIVYKARQLRLNRVVALKMILAGDFAGPDAVKRIMAEAEIVARLQHPNIVQIHAIGDFEGRPYVELEYVAGGSLAAQLDGTPWPARAAARLVESLALAMAEAHRRGIVHRDLKPANVLMTHDGVPKITDFGLAKSLEQDSGLTRTESILGSPRYMAPEQAEGQTRDVGPAADVYALGTNLYELLTGRPPFTAPTVLATLELVKNAEPVAPTRLQPTLALDLETICLKCLRKDPKTRYESAEALAEDLRRYLHGEPILARPVAWWERASKWVWRRPTLAALVVVSTLSVMATVGGVLWYRADVSRQRALGLRRAAAVSRQVQQFVRQGEEAIRRMDWDGAKTHVSSALALSRAEHELAPYRESLARMLTMTEQKIAGRARRDAARARFAAFQNDYDEAVFYQSQYTGLDRDTNLRASRTAARRALDQFHEYQGTDGLLILDPAHFSDAEAKVITARYYELSLILADAISQPLPGEETSRQARESLRILDRAARVHPPTAVFRARRRAYQQMAGENENTAAPAREPETISPAEYSVVDDFLEGEDAYRARDFKRAAQAFRQVLAREPDHFWAQYLLAICHLKDHRFAEAQAVLTACQNRRPGFVWTYLLKGFAEGEMHEFALAELDFARATELGLGDVERYVMLVNRGVMRIRQGRLQDAVDDFQKAIALKPDQFEAYINLAQALQALDRLDDAVAILDKAIARIRNQGVLYRARAQLHRARSADDQALADLGRAIETTTDDDPARVGDYLERALIEEKAGRHDEALGECDRALGIEPGNPDVHRARGAVLVKLKRFEQAIRSFDVCVAAGNRSAALYEARGLALAYLGFYDRAIADYTLALTMGPATASLYTGRGWAYLLSGAPSPAVRDFDAALRLDPSDERGLSGRALANVQQHQIADALADARASTEAKTPEPRLLYNAARVYCQAAASLEADPGRSREGWTAAGRYRAQSLALIDRSLNLMPEADRPRFWTQVVRDDAALEPIRKSKKFLELESRVAQAVRAQASPMEGSR